MPSFHSATRPQSLLSREGSARRRPVRLQVEALEERTVPSASLFLGALYPEALGRGLDGPGEAYWGGLLSAGVSRTDVARGVLTSSEGQTHLLRGMYGEVLGRELDPIGLEYWLGQMQSGASPEQVRASLLGSDEWWASVGGTIDGYVRNLYRRELGRELDPVGGAFFGGQLVLGQSRTIVAFQVLSSAEYQQRLVGGLYDDLLGRAADGLGSAYWVGAMQYGTTSTGVRAGLLGSDEFFNHLLTSSGGTPGGSPTGGPPPGGIVKPGGPGGSEGGDPGSPTGGGGSEPGNPALPPSGGGPLEPTGPTPGGPGGPGTGGLILLAPDFTTTTTPMLLVDLIAMDDSFLNELARVDVDVNHNGRFDDPGEQDFGFAQLNEGGREVRLNRPLPVGQFAMQARAVNPAGSILVSQPVDILVDPHAGFLGSQDLVRLHEEYLEFGSGEGAGIPGSPGDSESLQRFIDDHPQFVIDDQGRVLISARAALPQHLATFRSTLEELGMRVIDVTPAQNLVSGFLPIEAITLLPTVSYFSAATPVWTPVRRVGLANTQGDPVMGSDVFRANFGVDGSGVKVGVISDSVNLVDSNGDGVAGVAESQATGDLPAVGVQILQDSTSPMPTDEGRGMLEIIHDVAPGAALAFHSSDTPQIFASGIDALVAAGSRVVLDDIGFFSSPFFNDGVIAQAADRATANGSVYLSAAGNSSDVGWQDSFRGAPATIAGVPGTFHDLGGGDVLQDFFLPVGGLLFIDFQWDDAYLEGGSPLGNFQVNTDIDVLITDATGTQLLGQANTNNLNTDEAFELGFFFNDGSFGTNNFALAFELVQGPPPTALRWVSLGDDPLAQGQGGPTTWGQPGARTALAIGAVPWFAPSSPEPFTSVGGPLTFLFDAQGNRLSIPEVRQKPNVAAPDNGNTSFFGTDIPEDADTLPNFAGTSAAAPHAAAAVALLIDLQPAVTDPTTIALHLMRTARDVAVPGFDPVTGFGLVQLVPIGNVGIPPDLLEPNETSDQAIDFGTLVGVEFFPNLSISNARTGLPDYDWFRWSAGRTGVFTADITQIALGDLELHVFTLVGSTLVELGNSLTPGLIERSVVTFVTEGQPLFVEVKGRNSTPGVQDQGFYRLNVTL